MFIEEGILYWHVCGRFRKNEIKYLQNTIPRKLKSNWSTTLQKNHMNMNIRSYYFNVVNGQ